MKKWEHVFEKIETGKTKHKIRFNSKAITNIEFIENLITSDSFIDFFNVILRQCLFEAYFFEVKPFSLDSINHEFEFVLINSPTLSTIKADKSSFENYFSPPANVVSFLNLGKDATLIVPTNISNEEIYNHLANFARNALMDQTLDFWKMVGNECKNQLTSKTMWLSTAGLGVHWLHLRIDSRPKYYRYKPYKNY